MSENTLTYYFFFFNLLVWIWLNLTQHLRIIIFNSYIWTSLIIHDILFVLCPTTRNICIQACFISSQYYENDFTFHLTKFYECELRKMINCFWLDIRLLNVLFTFYLIRYIFYMYTNNFLSFVTLKY